LLTGRTVDPRAKLREAEVELSQVAIGDGLCQRRPYFQLLRVDHVEPAIALDVRLRARHLGIG
jgi:hypothetical protein